ncbi:hypothetical protein CHELA40_13545 [Chelatococcus asaccharovorans]|nr:hypothetical protein CHELA40_13545 [Chelatococcus asaccharovorans]CAH1677288.1 hypothetical protein CHELA17_62077 [Chelatococcus asaccharovorans]
MAHPAGPQTSPPKDLAWIGQDITAYPTYLKTQNIEYPSG